LYDLERCGTMVWRREGDSFEPADSDSEEGEEEAGEEDME
jgi:hypothetical protein